MLYVFCMYIILKSSVYVQDSILYFRSLSQCLKNQGINFCGLLMTPTEKTCS